MNRRNNHKIRDAILWIMGAAVTGAFLYKPISFSIKSEAAPEVYYHVSRGDNLDVLLKKEGLKGKEIVWARDQIIHLNSEIVCKDSMPKNPEHYRQKVGDEGTIYAGDTILVKDYNKDHRWGDKKVGWLTSYLEMLKWIQNK